MPNVSYHLFKTWTVKWLPWFESTSSGIPSLVTISFNKYLIILPAAAFHKGDCFGASYCGRYALLLHLTEVFLGFMSHSRPWCDHSLNQTAHQYQSTEFMLKAMTMNKGGTVLKQVPIEIPRGEIMELSRDHSRLWPSVSLSLDTSEVGCLSGLTPWVSRLTCRQRPMREKSE